MTELPSGTVTFLFTDIEGSTSLLKQLGERYGDVLAEHDRIMRSAIADAGGQEIDTLGDRGARICSAAHGGQVLLSNTTRDLVEDDLPPDVRVRDLGEHMLKNMDRPERLCQLVVEGLPADFPPPRTAEGQSDALVGGRERELAEAADAAVAGPQTDLASAHPRGGGSRARNRRRDRCCRRADQRRVECIRRRDLGQFGRADQRDERQGEPAGRRAEVAGRRRGRRGRRLGHERKRRNRLQDRREHRRRHPDDHRRHESERDRRRRWQRLGCEPRRRHRLADQPGDEHRRADDPRRKRGDGSRVRRRIRVGDERRRSNRLARRIQPPRARHDQNGRCRPRDRRRQRISVGERRVDPKRRARRPGQQRRGRDGQRRQRLWRRRVRCRRSVGRELTGWNGAPHRSRDRIRDRDGACRRRAERDRRRQARGLGERRVRRASGEARSNGRDAANRRLPPGRQPAEGRRHRRGRVLGRRPGLGKGPPRRQADCARRRAQHDRPSNAQLELRCDRGRPSLRRPDGRPAYGRGRRDPDRPRSGDVGARADEPGDDPAQPAFPVAARFVSLLDQLGYRTRLREFPAFDSYFDTLAKTHPQAGLAGWFGLQLPDDIFNTLSCGFSDNWADFCDHEVDAQVRTLSREEAENSSAAPKLAARIDRTVVDRAPWVPLFNARLPDFVSKRVGNYRYNIYDLGVLLDQLWVR